MDSRAFENHPAREHDGELGSLKSVQATEKAVEDSRTKVEWMYEQ